MTISPKLCLRAALVFCVVVGLYDALYVGFVFTGGPRIGPPQWVLFPDFLTPFAALRAYVEGKLAIVYDIDVFTDFQNAIYAQRFGHYVGYRPFLYPPIWLLMLLPLALLTVNAAFVVFMLVTVGASAIERRKTPWAWLAVATSPAAVWVVVSGQNTFLSVALLYGGLRLLERAPATAGVLLGLLAYKPQICLLVPVALLAGRHWRALAWAAATVIALALASALVFGLDFWWGFIEMTRASSGPRMVEYVVKALGVYMVTPFVSALVVGLPQSAASTLQLAAAALAAVAVWFAFRRHGPSEARTALFIAATFLVSPYMLNYDLLLLMPVAFALFRQGAAGGLHVLEVGVYAALWLIPTLNTPLTRHHLPVAPLIVLAFGVMAWIRLQDSPRLKPWAETRIASSGQS